LNYKSLEKNPVQIQTVKDFFFRYMQFSMTINWQSLLLRVTLIFLFIFYLVRLWLGCIPKISFVTCLGVPVWVGGCVGGGGGWL
jgi:hypothetical protein